MSTPYQDAGRTGQKRRTLEALVAVAREAVAAGETPTVDSTAAAAGVARSTAYRYFPSQRELLAAAHPETARKSLLPADAPEDPEARLDAVVREFTQLIVTTEAQQRTMLRLSLDPDPAEPALPLRQGRAIAWIEEALNPLRDRFSAPEIRALALAVRSATGIEALVWLTDIGGLSREQAMESMRWSARALLQQALASGPPPGVQR
ncbi:TetR/AcrR family transcriptional regulator [Arthrobacter sp. PsM3]|uniref:TetR/AcrR family transcriptional regulator n=1 Tax=Arthrobacter sp. PsM3 TaxID=3030531 RepID=UPI00263B3BBA|nr:helix-turn-helix domain-containing protein [Arthrobacter sp. PsM3]MDN4642791.1 helix-turn-helix domain containing protein [Arthrobacter sp. PsM3]